MQTALSTGPATTTTFVTLVFPVWHFMTILVSITTIGVKLIQIFVTGELDIFQLQVTHMRTMIVKIHAMILCITIMTFLELVKLTNNVLTWDSSLTIPP